MNGTTLSISALAFELSPLLFQSTHSTQIAPVAPASASIRRRQHAQQMTELAEVLEGIDDFSIEGQEPIVMKWVEDKGYKLGDVMNAFRLTLVGEGKGPGMFDISAFLGKQETLSRLRKAIEVLG